jgi:hypothetical protein
MHRGSISVLFVLPYEESLLKYSKDLHILLLYGDQTIEKSTFTPPFSLFGIHLAFVCHT